MSEGPSAGVRGGRRRLGLTVIVGALILTLTFGVRALRNEPEGPGLTAAQNRDLLRLRGQWTLATLSVDGQEFDVPSAQPIDLELGESSASGWTGCHAYATVYTASPLGSLSIDPLGVTPSTCTPEDDALADTYLDAFALAVTWAVAEDGTLELRGKGITATYTRSAETLTPTDPRSDPPAWVGTWRLASIQTTARTFEVDAEDNVWIGIGAIRATGSAGCNAFFGRVSALGARGIFFDRLVIGLKTCVGNETIMRRESELMDALANVNRWEMDDAGRLVLSGRGATVVLTLEGPPPSIDTAPPI
ncbi:MAG: META domain-containing protein [Bifidobacteriaceae bacterium]|jgi:heat shock protein HslJ|nr:META domain-containing protein [Bifidobacteriaceae bacterium]